MRVTHIDITPQHPTTFGGRLNRPAMHQSVHEGLEANILSMPGRDGAVIIISIDTLFAGDDLHRLILETLPQRVRQTVQDLILVASHTHTAPMLDMTKSPLGAVDTAYMSYVVVQISQAIVALHDMPDDAVRVERGKGYDTQNASRRTQGLRILKTPPFIKQTINMCPNHNADIPRDIDVLVGKGDGGQLKFILWQWACHAASVPQYDRALSSDFPGRVRRLLREKSGHTDLPILYFPGFSGDLRADYAGGKVNISNRIMTPFQRPFSPQSWSGFDAFCEGLCENVMQAVTSADAISMTSVVGVGKSEIPSVEVWENPNVPSISVTYLHAGGFAALLCGAEMLSGYMPVLSTVVPEDTFLSGCAAHVVGYLPTDKDISEGGYEVDGFQVGFCVQSRFKPHINAVVRQSVEKAVKNVQ